MAHDAKRAQRRERKREREGVECKREQPGYSTEVPPLSGGPRKNFGRGTHTEGASIAAGSQNEKNCVREF